jgi:hypothetical protein
MSAERSANPWIPALLNFFIWGGGYIYNGKRKTFGAGLIAVAILEHSPLLVLGLNFVLSYPYYLYLLGHLLISTLFAYDAYNEARDGTNIQVVA